MTRAEAARQALDRWARERKTIDRLIYGCCVALSVIAAGILLLTPEQARSLRTFAIVVCGTYAGLGAFFLGLLACLIIAARSGRPEDPGDPDDRDGS